MKFRYCNHDGRLRKIEEQIVENMSVEQQYRRLF
jgi:hypothetical protein